MPTGHVTGTETRRLRKRTACEGCGEPGQYEAREWLSRRQGAWIWHCRFLCAPCLVMAQELVGWDSPAVAVSEDGW